MRAYIRHVRRCDYCSKGLRAFLQRHGISVSDFLKNGVTTERLRAIPDVMAHRVADVAEAEARNGR